MVRIILTSQTTNYTIPEGRIHWNVVEWALMSEYKDVIPIREINAKIPIINVSANAILCDVVKALKKTLQK